MRVAETQTRLGWRVDIAPLCASKGGSTLSSRKTMIFFLSVSRALLAPITSLFNFASSRCSSSSFERLLGDPSRAFLDPQAAVLRRLKRDSALMIDQLFLPLTRGRIPPRAWIRNRDGVTANAIHPSFDRSLPLQPVQGLRMISRLSHEIIYM